MALLKKVSPTWAPSENKDLKVGETVEITDYKTLVMTGAAVLVDEQGNELPLPGEVFTCPVCTKKFDSLSGFVAHVNTHKASGGGVAPEEKGVSPAPVVTSTVDTAAEATETKTIAFDASLPTPDELAKKSKRLEALAKAREALRAKRAGK